ncbi:hypothetical protein MN116_000807 [Schistosoma mekongi]|uniref:Uncharacterized protein n=1 Tax=Schistosoma mekongi TaxID=38744 RepID=A0AAE2D9U9_SCHME|nr:hypothetical protein MN116_000807 [Schistosoma mekongi]
MKKSYSPKCSEVTPSHSNDNRINEKSTSRSFKRIEENKMKDSLKVSEVSENAYNQENNESQLSDSDISTPTDEMKTILNEKLIDNNHNEIQLSMDVKSFTERRQERRKRYKAKKGYNLLPFDHLSMNSSIDDNNNNNLIMNNTMIEESNETINANNCLVLSDSNDSQLDYFILETHNMCEVNNSIEITNLDEAEVNDSNAKNSNDSIDVSEYLFFSSLHTLIYSYSSISLNIVA